MSLKQQAFVVPGHKQPYEQREIDRPTLSEPNDILVRVKAVAINPADYKVRDGMTGQEKEGDPFDVPNKVLGWDAAGIVEAVGTEVTQFKGGDEVYYAGSAIRQGCFQQYQLVDARIVGRKPRTLTWEQAAALPLTTITAYEGMKELLNVKAGESILVTGGAGGVGSMVIQLAKLWGMSPIIATASRPETIEWSKSMGADVVIDHRKGIAKEFASHGLKPPATIFNAGGENNLPELAEVVGVNGRIVLINPVTDASQIPAFGKLFFKRVQLLHEQMFARSFFGFDQQYQGNLLNEVAGYVDQGKLKSTLNTTMSWKQIHEANKLVESGKAVGKVVLTVE